MPYGKKGWKGTAVSGGRGMPSSNLPFGGLRGMLQSTESDESLLTIPEVARRLKVSRAEAYLIVRRHDFPLLVLSDRILRVRPADLNAWLDECRAPTARAKQTVRMAHAQQLGSKQGSTRNAPDVAVALPRGDDRERRRFKNQASA